MALGTSSESAISPAAQARWWFGNVELNESLARLHVAGGEVALDRSSYDILLALLRHAGELVTKNELLEIGWPGRVVSENSLAKAISRLRTALGAEANAIRAVHGYGYRLAATVRMQPVPVVAATPPNEAARLHPGDPVPHRPGWRLQRRLGVGGSGIAYLACSQAGESRAFKFATSESGVLGLKREIALTRYIRAVKPDLPDVALVLDWNLRQQPFFVELPYFSEGHLGAWAEAQGGLPQVDPQTRLELCALLCETMAGLHEIGVIHKDLKPENLYPARDAEGRWHMMLSDLGAGEAMPSPRLAELGLSITMAGSDAGRLGSLLYVAPEVIAGDAPTQRSDVFALGVLLYQLVVGDLRRPLAPGWEDDIDDPLLREDIALAAASNPERRQLDPRALAERLRALDARRQQRADERHERALAEQRERTLLHERSRHRLWLTAALAAGIGLLGALGMYLYAEKARRDAVAEAARADAEAGKSRKLVEFLSEDILRQADPFVGGKGGEISLRQAIDNAAKNVDARFGGDPVIAATIHGTLGSVYSGLNDWDASVAHHQAQLSRLRAAQPRDMRGIARASGQLCIAHVWQGDPVLRRKACEQARDDYTAAGLEPDLPEVFLALVDSREGRDRQGLARLEPRMPRIRTSADKQTRNFAFHFASLLYRRLGRMRDAERAQAEQIALSAGQPASMDLAWALAEHGRSLLTLGRMAEGRSEIARSRRMFEQVAGPEHPQGHAPLIFLSAIELANGSWHEARALAEPAYRDLMSKVAWTDHWTTYSILTLIAADAESGDRTAARELMTLFEDVAVESDLERQMSYLREPYWTSYATAHLALGEAAQAERYVRKLKTLVTEPDASPLLLANVECVEGRLQLARGEKAAALSNARNCRKRILAATSPTSPLLGAPDRLLAALGEKP